ncbi:MAG: DUF6476 family protein [Acetobacteraceae bacterium]|nr:DUF6476 family protein [Acetobacteraceae bacterium]MCX7685018.1 DUF6476 family protein [Acetobacteraceae bacterium]MDW8399827.1 DUF6476 family protein [Acetobacteraceae bacterium]
MRALTILVAVMGVMIVAGTVALAVVIVQRLGGAAEAPMAAGSLGQPEGSRIGGIASAEGRVAVWVVRPDGDRLLLLDGRSGRVVGELRVSP